MEKKLLKIAGIAGVVGGCISLYFAGVSEDEVIGLVAGIFVLGGVIAAIFGKTESN